MGAGEAIRRIWRQGGDTDTGRRCTHPRQEAVASCPNEVQGAELGLIPVGELAAPGGDEVSSCQESGTRSLSDSPHLTQELGESSLKYAKCLGRKKSNPDLSSNSVANSVSDFMYKAH